MNFNDDLTNAIEELELMQKAITQIKRLDDDEAEALSDKLYPFIDTIAQIGEDDFDFSFDEVRSYFKVKAFLEIGKNLEAEKGVTVHGEWQQSKIDELNGTTKIIANVKQDVQKAWDEAFAEHVVKQFPFNLK